MDARIPAAAILLALIAGGGSVWFGLYQSWTRTRSVQRNVFLVLPWSAIAEFDILVTRLAGVSAPDWLADGLLLGGFALGLVAATFEWPPLLLPPWYREFKRSSGDAVTRSNSAHQVGGKAGEPRG